MKIQVPFYSQKWNLSEWQQLGFKNLKETEYWEKSSCGILCLKMAIDSFLLIQNKPLSPIISKYISKGIEIGAYKDSVGWSHKGLTNLSKQFGFFANNYNNVSIDKLSQFLEQNYLTIISIKWAFDNTKSLKEKILFWKKYGGHLALVVGYEEEKGKLTGFYVHHTSIYQEYNWQYKFIPVE